MEFFFTHLGLQHLASLGYWLVFLIVFGESLAFIGFLIPGSILVVIAGGLAAQGIYDFWPLFLVTTVAAIIGNTVSYELGRHGKGFLRRHPWLWKHVIKGQAFFERHGVKSVFIGHFLGPVRHAIPVAAGAADMKRSQFQLANVPSAAVWAITHLAVGYIFGSFWRLALVWSSRVGIILAVLVLLGVLVVFCWRWVLRHGPDILDLLRALASAIQATLLANPSIRDWTKRHATTLRFLRDRFSTKSFFGLPFTILSISLLYTIALLLGLVQDYLSNDPLIAADKRLANLLFAFRSPPLLHFFYFVTLFAESGIVIALTLLVSLLLWLRRQRIFLFTLWLTLIASEGTTYLGKMFFHRLRPDAFIRAIVEDSFSFPSGHATTAVAFYGFLAYLLIRTHRSWNVKVGAFFAAVSIVFLIDVSRLYLGVHYVSDVLAGDLVGLTALLFSISVTEWLLWSWKQPVKPTPLGDTVMVGLGAICLVSGIFTFAPSPWKTAQSPLTEQIGMGTVLSLFQKGGLPLTTETIIGSPQEPINLIIVAPERCLVASMAKAGWRLADDVSLHTLKQAIKAAVWNQGYAAAPMTPSFYDARPHDLGFEKATEQQTIRARHHARFWKTRYVSGSGTLFVGTVSLDTGIKWGITHSISPDIDTERHLIVSDLRSAGALGAERETSLVSPTLGKNFAGDEFFTDGQASVSTLQHCN